jgi:hypothetical protein
MRAGRNGGKLRSGNPRGARTRAEQREAFLAKMRALMNAPATLKAIGKVLANPNHQHFPAIARLAAEYSWGKAQQFVDVEVRTPVDDEETLRKLEAGFAAIAERQEMARRLAADRPALRQYVDDHHSPDGGS